MKGIAGFYYVYVAESGIYECKARGIFRKQKIKPLVGDRVVIEILDQEKYLGNVTEILTRTNVLDRPAAANIDQVLLLFALRTPDPNFVLLDRFLIAMEMRGIPCEILLNKADLVSEEEKREIAEAYADCGHRVRFISVRENIGMEEIRELLAHKITALAGPSGSGKSSFTNAVKGQEIMETGEISRKLARGKNTTRHCELVPIGPDAFLCDTPGFMAFETSGIKKEELRNYYDEFLPYTGQCRFDSCVHITEPDCRVKDALQQGKISRLRYENYCMIYETLKEAESRMYR